MSPSRLKRSQRRERRKAMRAVLRLNLCDTLLAVWRHARWVFLQFCDFHASPRALAEREWIVTHEYRKIEAWLRAIELLTRRLVLAAALALNIVVKPLIEREHAQQRRRRRVLVWLQKPETWIARFHMFPKRPPEVHVVYQNTRDVPRVMRSFPLARGLEAVHRVLADPDQRIHRLATKLAAATREQCEGEQPAPLRRPRLGFTKRHHARQAHHLHWHGTRHAACAQSSRYLQPGLRARLVLTCRKVANPRSHAGTRTRPCGTEILTGLPPIHPLGSRQTGKTP